VRCDVSGVEPDAVCVDALARLQLAARKRGCCVCLENASAALLDLVELMGLTHVLPADGSRRFATRPRWKNRHMANYTLTNLHNVEDAAVKGGFSESQEARFANEDLELETLGVSYQIVKPGKHHAFGHRHKEAEEVYVVLAGSGKIHLDDEEVAVERLDAIRVAPEVTRGFEADSDELELLVFSQKTPGDAEIVEDYFDE
jgi:mannose-6-phosphate isomerase-like protein (cupin superfamily)